MLSVQEATQIVRKGIPNGKIQAQVEYKNLYLFQVFRDDPGEEEMDPFCSVDKETGKFSDFSILTDGNTSEIVDLFTKEKERRRKEGTK